MHKISSNDRAKIEKILLRARGESLIVLVISCVTMAFFIEGKIEVTGII